MVLPVFAYGTYDALVAAVESGKVKYPTYAWLNDTLQYAFVNKNKEIEIVGHPKLTGTLDNQIVLSNLDSGIYSIKGQYKVTEDAETVYLSASYVIVIVKGETTDKKVRIITVDDILDFSVEEGEITDQDETATKEYVESLGYVTEDTVDIKMAAMETSLKTEMKDYVDSIIADQVAALLPDEIDKIFNRVPEDDMRALFDTPSI